LALALSVFIREIRGSKSCRRCAPAGLGAFVLFVFFVVPELMEGDDA
jgi:hypothetical protein